MAISKRANGHYQARIQGPDGKMMGRTFPTRKEAQMQLLTWRQQKWNGVLGTGTDHQMTLDAYFQEWYQDVLEETPEHLRSGWRTHQNQQYKDFVSPLIGRCKLKEIRPQNVKRVVNEMAKLGKSESTRVHVFGLLRKMFGDAIETYQYLT